MKGAAALLLLLSYSQYLPTCIPCPLSDMLMGSKTRGIDIEARTAYLIGSSGVVVTCRNSPWLRDKLDTLMHSSVPNRWLWREQKQKQKQKEKLVFGAHLHNSREMIIVLTTVQEKSGLNLLYTSRAHPQSVPASYHRDASLAAS